MERQESLAELAESGIVKGDRDLFLDCLSKCGAQLKTTMLARSETNLRDFMAECSDVADDFHKFAAILPDLFGGNGGYGNGGHT